MTLCPGKSFALDFLFTVGIKIVCELYLSFDGFIDNAPDNSTALGGKSYVFLSAGKFMPGMEKLAGDFFFSTNQQLFLTTEGSKNSWF